MPIGLARGSVAFRTFTPPNDLDISLMITKRTISASVVLSSHDQYLVFEEGMNCVTLSSWLS